MHSRHSAAIHSARARRSPPSLDCCEEHRGDAAEDAARRPAGMSQGILFIMAVSQCNFKCNLNHTVAPSEGPFENLCPTPHVLLSAPTLRAHTCH